ncbi:MAG: leucine--tRNA ligase [Planctomycetes bacterium]|nr:leucine--tRNA ligase [Planctomycetota bacterium]
MPSTQQHRNIYDFATIEAKWQELWEKKQTFHTPNPGDDGFDPSKPKCYVLDMFPYPSGAGLHVGHPIGYCATDIYVRCKRMKGVNVLHPMGYDAFGLPAEQYAIETGVHPAVTTKANIDNMRRQLKRLGFCYDWSRELATCDPRFYRFTQWIFLRLFDSWYDDQADAARPISELIAQLESGAIGVDSALGLVRNPNSPDFRRWSDLDEGERRNVPDAQRLAYMDEVPVNWCPALGTVLANEEVTNEGRSDRGDHPVYRRPLRQWMLRITRYADRLLADLDALDWPESIKLMQRHWIGRSTGADVDFPIDSGKAQAPAVGDVSAWRGARKDAGFPAKAEDFVIRAYTTRPDTLFGATYMVLAPEHPLVDQITTDEQGDAVNAYVQVARHKSELDRTAATKEKTGVFTGAYAINPVNGDRIPIWVADYVLMGYGTGAIMAVPSGDSRDFEFAKAFGLDIVTVVEPTTEWADQIARLPKGTLNELRHAAADRLRDSVQRWKAEGTPQRRKQIEFAEGYLKEHQEDAGLTAEAVQRLYIAAPELFEEPFVDEGVSVQSPARATPLGDDVCDINGLSTPEATRKIIQWLEGWGVGRGAVHFKLRDWIFSRQKYWGEPFPVLHGRDGAILALDDSELPVELPEVSDFEPEVSSDPEALPRPPLARVSEWMNVERNGNRFTRDANTMPQWAGSCWYYLRYISPHDDEHFCDPEAEKYWMPVDLYVGGAEHAVLHLLYARFWHKVLYDLGYVSTTEPFLKLVNQGMVQAFAYRDDTGRLITADLVEEVAAGRFVAKETQRPVNQVIAKMSKSLKNVVSPDEIIAEYGADAFRIYEMYMGPIESSKPWNTRDVPGMLKLLQRIWRLVVDEETGGLSPALVDREPDDEEKRLLHKTIKGISEGIEQLKFNTAIARMFEFVNYLTPRSERPRSVIESFVLLIAPFAPHLAEELWQRLGHDESLAHGPWPEFDPRWAKDEQVEIAVQVQGKIKSRIMVPAEADEKALETAALADDRVKKAVAGKTIRKVIVVKGRLVNLIVG